MKKSFVFANICIPELKNLHSWCASGKKDYLEIVKNKSRIYLSKRDSYPKTFFIQKNNFIILGYIEPQLYAKLEKSTTNKKQLVQFITQIKKKLNKEFLLIVLEQSPAKIRIYRDAICTIPIFYLEKNSCLLLSNEFSTLLPYLAKDSPINIDFKTLAEYLLHIEKSPEKTIFTEIKLLTERSILIKNKKEIKIQYPKAWPVLQKLSIKKDFTPVFANILETTLNDYWAKFNKNTKIGFEISGGIDSLTPAGFYAKKGKKPLKSFSMLLPEKEEKGQITKLQIIKKFLGLEMQITPIADLFPLKSQLKLKKPKPFYPTREIYFEALNKMANQAKKQGIQVIITGMGGDEAFIIDPRESTGNQGPAEKRFRHSLKFPSFFTKRFVQKFFDSLSEKAHFPTPAVPYSVLRANMSRNNTYVSHGIWPVAPLADPKFAMFCRGLPKVLRKNKKILRQYQKNQDWPKNIYDPEINENFANFFKSNINNKIKKTLIKLFENSYLAKLGLINNKKLIKSYLSYAPSKKNINPLHFYSIAVIEILLQSFNNNQS